jgi:hypothetical protein
MSKVFIYSLENPITKEVRYIGKTVQKLEKRLTAHIYESKHRNNHKCNWINKLNKNNNRPIIKLLDTVSEEDWEFWEMYWIEQFKSWGFNLVNHTSGGEGYTHSEETKEKIRQANSGKNHYFYGKRHKQTSKDKISKSLIGNNYAKGFKHSDETKKKVSKGNREYYKNNPMTDKHKKRISESNRLAKSDPKIKKEISERIKKYCRDNPQKIKRRIMDLAELNKNNARPIYQKDKGGKFIKKFNSIRDASNEVNINSSNIYRCANGIRKTCGGFRWEWV